MHNKKPLLFLLCAAILALIVKYSDSILQAIQLIFSLLMPIFIGCGIAYVLNLLIVRLEALPVLAGENSRFRPARRVLSITGALVIIVAVLVLLVVIILPQLADAFRVMLLGIPPLLDQFAEWLNSFADPTPQIQQWLNTLDINWPQFLEKAANYLTSGMGSIFSSAVSIVSNVGGLVMQVVIAFIFALYLLAGKEHLAGQCRSLAEVYLSPKTYRRLMYVFSTANETFSKFFIGQFTEYVENKSLGKDLYGALADVLKEYDMPVCFNFPVGHVTLNVPLVNGARVTLEVGKKEARLSFALHDRNT